MDYYVYKLLRPWNSIPCYIGKGRGPRSTYHNTVRSGHRNKHLASIYRKAGDVDLPVEIVASGLSENEAFALEIKLIAEIGRADQGKGPLANWTDGGEGTSGSKRSAAFCEANRARGRLRGPPQDTPETRAKISAALTGRKISDETRAKMREARNARGPQTEQQKQRASETMKRRWADNEQRETHAAAIAKARTGSKLSDATRAKIRAARIAYWERRRAGDGSSL